MSLPFLPGNSFKKTIGKYKYHKSHHLDTKNGVSFLFGDDKSGIGGDPFPGQRVEASRSQYPNGENSGQPAWVAFDKQVLSFDAFYQEGVNERREEQFRIRNCKIYFYLEDDSIQVIEARSKNSGINQGTIIKRHRVTRPSPNNDQYYTIDDLNVGETITLYNKVFKITGCDEFTQNFLRKLGTRVGQPEKQPADPYTEHRKAMEESMQALRPYERHDTLKQFIDHDGHVLRFYCFWDDTDTLYGDPREMILHYFLADDTIEIREVIGANSGRDSAPCFLKRQKLVKNHNNTTLPGQRCDRTVLNVFGHIQSGRYILDNLKTGSLNLDFYKDSDLKVGSSVNVYGRKFLIRDCDEFTKEYYRSKYGWNDFQTNQYAKSYKNSCAKLDPPYNGWGSEEDSLGNCRGLLPRPPQRDFVKFMEKDRCGLESHVLRFMARLESEKAIDKSRTFIISYFLADDTILVFEPTLRNSGIQGGKFLERSKVKRVGQPRYNQSAPQYYASNDFYVGATISINNFHFVIEDCDEYAYRYMEAHGDEYPLANIDKIMQKMRAKICDKRDELFNFCSRNDPDSVGSIAFEQARNLLRQSNHELTDHEIITVCRHYALRLEEDLSFAKVFGAAQAQLRKHNFENFKQLDQAAHHMDRKGTGTLTPEELRLATKTMQLPIPDDLLRAAMLVNGLTQDGDVEYRTFVKNLNWHDNPLPTEVAIDQDEQWVEHGSKKKVDRVLWQQLLKDMCGANGTK